MDTSESDHSDISLDEKHLKNKNPDANARKSGKLLASTSDNKNVTETTAVTTKNCTAIMDQDKSITDTATDQVGQIYHLRLSSEFSTALQK